MSVAGTYNIVIKTPMGGQKGTFTVNADGDSFTGNVVNPLGNLEVLDGKISGNTLSWKMDVKVPMPMSFGCTATVDGDSITGEFDTGKLGKFGMSGSRAD